MPRRKQISRRQLYRRWIVQSAVLLVLAAAVIAPARTSAIGPTEIIVDIPRTIFQAIDKVRLKIAAAFKASGDIAFKSSVDLFERRLLDTVQTSLATTGPGQKPLFLSNPQTFFKNVANASAGDFIDNFSRGVTGQTGPGLPISGARGTFLIGRLLAGQANAGISGVTNDCKNSCLTTVSTETLNTADIANMTQNQADLLFSGLDGRKLKIAKVTYERNGPNGTVKTDAAGKALTTCRYVVPTTNSWAIDLKASWTIDPNAPGPQLFSDNKTCIEAQRVAILAEQSAAQAETNQCLQSCQVEGTAAKNAVNGLTQTNAINAVQNANPANAASSLANALSNDKSDLGQFLNAAGTLTATVQQDIVGQQTNLQPNNLPVTTKVSGEVITPSAAASSLFGIPAQSTGSSTVYTGTSVADILKGIASFINSPVGKALATYFNTKCGLNPDLCKGPSNARSTIGQLVFGSGAPTGLAGAQLLYASLGQAQINQGAPGQNDIAITDQLSSSGLIDAGFRQAIEETITVQEALTRGLLDAKKTFGFDKNGVEPTSGYAYRALQYLRKYRVIPVGWELAAKYSQLFDHRDLSLGFLTQRYQTCGQDSTHKVCSRGTLADHACQTDANCGLDDNGAPITCGASPYCGLVDPNWVLKAPQTYCRRQGAGEEIVSKEFVCDTNNIDATTGNVIPAGETCVNSDICTDQNPPNCVASAGNQHPDIGRWVIERNTDTCADSQSCIAENEDGSCQAYGYCVQERQQFKFDGTQCDVQNGTCTSYTNSVGQGVAYLANTLDSRNCTADNAGCTAYCAATPIPAGQPNAGQPNYNPATQTCADPSVTINFTAKVQSCSQTQVGCHQYLQTDNGANLLANGGFEDVGGVTVDSGQSANVTGWTPTGGFDAKPITPTDPNNTTDNKVALKVDGAPGDMLLENVPTGHELYERTFTMSVRAKADASCQAALVLAATGTCSNNAGLHCATDAMCGADGPCRPASSLAVSTLPAIPDPANSAATNANITTDWQTYQVTLTIPAAGVLSLPSTYDLTAGLRLNDCASKGLVIDSAQLEEAFSASPFKDYGAVNAVYLNSNRASCTAADVGCQNYTPVAGGTKVVGQVLNSNRCTADKVGCATYNLEPITNVPTRTGGSTNIVAPKGQLCSAADVGCEEYTNLDEVAKGGEGRQYFKSVKQCVKPSQTNAVNPVSATYYTWVGDAKLGYVLRAYDLVKSNVTNGPCTNMTVGSITTAPVCDDANWATINAACTAANFGSNPDCAQYYDSGLNAYYLLRQRTITITNDCHPFRNTVDQSDPALKDNVYYLSPTENLTCSATAAGCRAYTGNASGTTRQVVSDTFETNGTANWIGGTTSNDSVNVNGHSMLITLVGNKSSAVTVPAISTNQFYTGRTYIVTFNAAPASNNVAPAQLPIITADFGTYTQGNFTSDVSFPGTAVGSWNPNITPPGPEWKQYTLGPVTLTQNYADDRFALSVEGSSVNIDNVVLTEVNDHVYYIQSSLPICSAADVGCAAYRDQQGTVNYLTSFNRLCSEQVAGCQALIDTQNSSSPFSQTVGIDPAVTTPADTIVTLVNDPANYCPAAAKGCEAVGKAIYAPDQKITGYLTNYLINDPDRYATDLCQNNELSCQVYTTADNTAAYFKDPGQRVCDYRTNSDGSADWYITGTNQLCPSVNPPAAGRPVGPSCSPVCVGGDRAGQACTMLPASANECPNGTCQGDASRIGQIYQGGKYTFGSCTTSADCRTNPNDATQNSCIYLAGTCPAEQNGCTEYRDPTDPASCRSQCPLSLAQGGTPDYVDASCVRTQCKDGDRAGQNCATDADCQDSSGASHSCIGGDGQPTTGVPGCRSYFYLRQSIETNAGTCNGQVNTATGCRPFNDTSNPSLNYRGQ